MGFFFTLKELSDYIVLYVNVSERRQKKCWLLAVIYDDQEYGLIWRCC